MKAFKWNHIQSLKATVQDLIGEEDPVLLEFDVLPFDYKVLDFFSCRFYVSMTKLVLTVDELIEVYDLKNLEFKYIGKKPGFTLLEQFLEFNINLEGRKSPLIKELEIPDDFFRFLIYETNSQPKQFTLRRGNSTAKAFQTWGMVETVKRLREDDEDMDLHNMIYGNFSSFDPQFLVIGFIVFVTYVLLSIALGGILPDFLKNILDSVFFLGCIIFVIWLIRSMHLNTKRYAKVYDNYNKVVQPNQNTSTKI